MYRTDEALQIFCEDREWHFHVGSIRSCFHNGILWTSECAKRVREIFKHGFYIPIEIVARLANTTGVSHPAFFFPAGTV